MNLKQRLVLTLIGVGMLTNNLQSISIAEFVKREPRRLRIKKDWIPGATILDLGNMGIDSLKGLEGIAGIEKVTRLYLDHNNIGTIEAGDLAAAVNLRVLGLAHNGLVTIEQNAFAGLNNLKVLDLSSNNIESIPEEGLKGLSGLRFLGMANNPMPNPKKSLQGQVPKSFITVLPITRANLKKWGAVVGAATAALIAAVGLVVVGSRKPSKPVIGGSEGIENLGKGGEAIPPHPTEPEGIENLAESIPPTEEEQFSQYRAAQQKRIDSIYKKLNLPRGWNDEKLTAPTTSMLMASGLDDDSIVSLIESWRQEGHQFPDNRFDPLSVANALANYLVEQADFEIKPTISNEDSYMIGNQDYPESTIYAMSPEEREKLLLAITKDTSEADLNLIKKLIGWVANVNAQDNNGGTALIHAAYNNNTEAIRALLDAGADVNAQDLNGRTALMHAAYNKATEAIRALLAAGANVNAQDLNGHTTLMWAASKSNTEAIRALLAAGADVNAQDDDIGDTALMGAASNNNIDAIRALLAAPGIEVNAQTNAGRTALIWAAINNSTEAIRALLAAGADVNAQTKYGRTALIQAAYNNNTEAIRALLAAGAKVNVQDQGGDTALSMAERYGYTQIADFLREHGAAEQRVGE